MLRKLFTLYGLMAATIMLTAFLATTFSQTKAWSEDLLERSGDFLSSPELVCSPQADPGFSCVLNHGESFINMAFSPGESGQFIKHLITSPSSTTLFRQCYNGDENGLSYCEVHLHNSEFHSGDLLITLTKDWIPSKFTVATWVVAFFISVLMVIYVYQWAQKRRVQGTIVKFSPPSSYVSMPPSQVKIRQTKPEASYLNSMKWASKDRSTTRELEGYY